MKLIKYIANLGYGTRKEVLAMCDARRLRHVDGRILSADDRCAPGDILLDNEPLDPAPGSVVLLHKPTGYVCSTTDANPLVYDLLPERFRRRSPIMAPVGRLDRDTSGLLLLTDDGALIHRVTSPRAHLPKVYEVTLARDLHGHEQEVFGGGTLLLESEREPLRPARLERLDARRVRLTITEGRYHQVRRMFAAVGNHVESLHRAAVGAVALGDLPPAAWRLLRDEEVSALRAPAAP
ncbi:MAG: 16S rRNA pseudouridine(516) synthase [Gemmatimonadaceae bacterium]